MRSLLLLLSVPAATLLAGCGPRPDMAEPMDPGRSAAAAVRGQANPELGRYGASPTSASRTSRDPATAMGAPTAPQAAQPAASAKVDDAQITARVRAELAAARDLGDADAKIDVDTREGVVTLSGPVQTAAVKARAAEIARTVRGVVDVNDQLTLVMG